MRSGHVRSHCWSQLQACTLCHSSNTRLTHPVIGRKDAIGPRTWRYLTMVACSLLFLVLAVIRGQRLKPRFGTRHGLPSAGAAFAVAVGIVMFALRSVGELAANVKDYGKHASETPLTLKDDQGNIVYPGFSTVVLATSRVYSILAQALMWGTIGVTSRRRPINYLPAAQGLRRSLQMSDVDTDSVDRLGGYFAAESHLGGLPLIAPWHPLAELVDDPAAIQSRISAVAAALAASAGVPLEAIELRAAGSLAHLGVVARLLSPVIASAAIRGELAAMSLGQVWWQPQLGGPFPLSLPTESNSVSLSGLSSWLMDGPVGSLVEAFADAASVSRELLWGNVASVLIGALGQLDSAGVNNEDVERVRSEVLATRLLLNKIAATPRGWRRASCCLLYRVGSTTPAPICDDCMFQCD